MAAPYALRRCRHRLRPPQRRALAASSDEVNVAPPSPISNRTPLLRSLADATPPPPTTVYAMSTTRRPPKSSQCCSRRRTPPMTAIRTGRRRRRWGRCRCGNATTKHPASVPSDQVIGAESSPPPTVSMNYWRVVGFVTSSVNHVFYYTTINPFVGIV